MGEALYIMDEEKRVAGQADSGAAIATPLNALQASMTKDPLPEQGVDGGLVQRVRRFRLLLHRDRLHFRPGFGRRRRSTWGRNGEAGHELVHFALVDTRKGWTMQEVSVGTFVHRIEGQVAARHLVLAPDSDHRSDALLYVAQDVDDFGGALAGQVLERAGGEDLHHLRLDLGEEAGRVAATLAEIADKFQDALRRCQDFRRRAFCRNDDVVKFVRRGALT